MFGRWFGLLSLIVGGILFTPAFANDLQKFNLDDWVGDWQYQTEDYEENWDIKWNKEKTHLLLTFSSFEAGDSSFTGTGFIFHDANTGKFHFYLMMNNGALHENIGTLQNDDKYHLFSKTYGGPGFPDHEVIISLGPDKMKVEYVYKDPEAKAEVYTNQFLKKEKP